MRFSIQKDIRQRASAMGLYLPLFYCWFVATILTVLVAGINPSVIKTTIGAVILLGLYIILFTFQNMRPPSPSLPDKIINN